jgi:excisionase family DNA binding protein
MNENSLLDVREAAALLRIAPGTLYHWLSESRDVPVVRLGARCVRFRRSDLEQWISEKCVNLSVSHALARKSALKRDGQ